MEFFFLILLFQVTFFFWGGVEACSFSLSVDGSFFFFEDPNHIVRADGSITRRHTQALVCQFCKEKEKKKKLWQWVELFESPQRLCRRVSLFWWLVSVISGVFLVVCVWFGHGREPSSSEGGFEQRDRTCLQSCSEKIKRREKKMGTSWP